MTSLFPRKLPFFNRRDREFLYLHEVDALIAAMRQTRAPIRNQALLMLLFCQALCRLRENKQTPNKVRSRSTKSPHFCLAPEETDNN